MSRTVNGDRIHFVYLSPCEELLILNGIPELQEQKLHVRIRSLRLNMPCSRSRRVGGASLCFYTRLEEIGCSRVKPSGSSMEGPEHLKGPEHLEGQSSWRIQGTSKIQSTCRSQSSWRIQSTSKIP
ncbi:unnamed protein product [Pleuronectes platessa]|uniref:Uncharacterized protein n=1 Tax=Pleuronectes platessa TaxID=8262 RepID=A0A9N7UCN1_PLEPL|nr:unnamed protein product [Pleuronectes platessa]